MAQPAELPSSPCRTTRCHASTPVAGAHSSAAASVVPTPTPCRGSVAHSPDAASPFGTPVDPFIPRKTLQHTPPQQASRLIEALAEESPQQTSTCCDVAVQTDSAVDSLLEHFEPEHIHKMPRRSCAKRARKWLGTLLWWLVRATVMNALLMPWLAALDINTPLRAHLHTELEAVCADVVDWMPPVYEPCPDSRIQSQDAPPHTATEISSAVAGMTVAVNPRTNTLTPLFFHDASFNGSVATGSETRTSAAMPSLQPPESGWQRFQYATSGIMVFASVCRLGLAL